LREKLTKGRFERKPGAAIIHSSVVGRPTDMGLGMIHTGLLKEPISRKEYEEMLDIPMMQDMAEIQEQIDMTDTLNQLDEANIKTNKWLEDFKTGLSGVERNVNLVAVIVNSKDAKEAFLDFGKSTLDMLIQMIIKQLMYNAISGIMGPDFMKNGGSTSSTGFAPGRADGGRVFSNQRYIVGEEGPEVLDMYSSGGNVIPMSGGRSSTSMPAPVFKTVINNNTGGEAKVSQSKPRFDGTEYVQDIIISSMESNSRGFKDKFVGVLNV